MANVPMSFWLQTKAPHFQIVLTAALNSPPTSVSPHDTPLFLK